MLPQYDVDEPDPHGPQPDIETPLRPEGPTIDQYGVIRHGERWAAVPERQVAVARLLVANMGSVVPYEMIRDAYLASGGSGVAGSQRTLIRRLRLRLREVGLQLSLVRGRGFLLEGSGTSSNDPMTSA